MASKFQMRRDSSTNWSSTNPVLASGELGFETNTGLLKVGNGTSAWNALSYVGTDYHRLTANGSAIGPAIADFFPTAAYSVTAGNEYEIEWDLYFTKTTAGTVTFTVASSVAPVNLVAHYVGGPVAGIGTAGAPITAALVGSTATAAALPATSSLTTGVDHHFVVKALVEAGATNGTVKLQVTSSAGTVTPLRGSSIKVTPLPTANYGQFA